MRFFLTFTFLCIALGIGFALEFDDALDTFDQLVDNTARQSIEDLDTIIPVFGIAFTASLLNNLIFRNGIALPTPAPAATTTTQPPPPPSTTAPPASTTAPPASTTAPPASTTAPPASTTVAPALPTQKQYCDKHGQSHIMCEFAGPSTTCADKTLKTGITDVQKQSIVDKHNELRRKVAKGEQPDQPAASNMREMVWNEELASIAQRYVDQCMDDCAGGAVFCHSEDAARKKLDDPVASNPPSTVGENLSLSRRSKGPPQVDVSAELTGAIEAWYNEVDGIHPDPDCSGLKFDSTNISPFQPVMNNKCHGHYTQVVWAESEEVGCGLVHFDEPSPPEPATPLETHVVCMYAPAGNILGTTMYKQGTAGSACDQGYTDNDGLCSKNKRKRINQRKKNKKNRRRNKNKKYN